MIPVTLHNFWPMSSELIESMKTIFTRLIGNITAYREIKIYTVFGDPPGHKESDVLYVQFSAESYYHDPCYYDINIIPESPNATNRVVLFPYAFLQLLHNDLTVKYDITRFTNPRTLDNLAAKRFCLFCVSNGNCKTRNVFFDLLSKYKRVDSGGKYLNNIGMTCPGQHISTEYFDFITQYKFMICFENISKPHYFTEKLINGYYGGTIPIYWGDPVIFNRINSNAILYLPPNPCNSDMELLINEIIRLDNDDVAYREKYTQPLFLNGPDTDFLGIAQANEDVGKLLGPTAYA